ncbi:MAG: PilZ domain-containing protein [bacterium]|nr:PilZ domain-containing protein [bacterium]
MALSKPTPEPTPPQGGGAERRQFDRARAEWPITIVLDDGPHEARVRDVSRGGVCFFLDRPLGEMTLLKMEFDLPVVSGVRRITGQGAVVRCERISEALDHYEIAVFLTEMAQPDRKTIETYVTSWRSRTVQ